MNIQIGYLSPKIQTWGKIWCATSNFDIIYASTPPIGTNRRKGHFCRKVLKKSKCDWIYQIQYVLHIDWNFKLKYFMAVPFPKKNLSSLFMLIIWVDPNSVFFSTQRTFFSRFTAKTFVFLLHQPKQIGLSIFFSTEISKLHNIWPLDVFWKILAKLALYCPPEY